VTKPQLYTWALRPLVWVAEDATGQLFVFEAQQDAWSKRIPYEGSRNALTPTKPYNAAGTGWPYWRKDTDT
jgi:hypothetical protein